KMPGHIVTFYSYKGGTGRTMTAANVAWILASNGKRVLAIDWHFEAPGLHRYFAPFIEASLQSSSEGLVDLFIGYVNQAKQPSPPASECWIEECADISRFAVSLDWDFPQKGTLDLVHAGRLDAGYPGRVAKLDWRMLYAQFKGGAFLELV